VDQSAAREGGPEHVREQNADRPPQTAERRERAPREGEAGGPEGFSHGPKPAFLRTD
jgi:hypothetical protein